MIFLVLAIIMSTFIHVTYLSLKNVVQKIFMQNCTNWFGDAYLTGHALSKAALRSYLRSQNFSARRGAAKTR